MIGTGLHIAHCSWPVQVIHRIEHFDSFRRPSVIFGSLEMEKISPVVARRSEADACHFTRREAQLPLRRLAQLSLLPLLVELYFGIHTSNPLAYFFAERRVPLIVEEKSELCRAASRLQDPCRLAADPALCRSVSTSITLFASRWHCLHAAALVARLREDREKNRYDQHVLPRFPR